MLECVKLKTLATPFKDKFEAMDWETFKNHTKTYLDTDYVIKSIENDTYEPADRRKRFRLQSLKFIR